MPQPEDLHTEAWHSRRAGAAALSLLCASAAGLCRRCSVQALFCPDHEDRTEGKGRGEEERDRALEEGDFWPGLLTFDSLSCRAPPFKIWGPASSDEDGKYEGHLEFHPEPPCPLMLRQTPTPSQREWLPKPP